MILVDSSTWIDYFRGVGTAQTTKLDSLLDSEPLAIGDLILVEMLQGFTNNSDFKKAKGLLTSLDVVDIGGIDIAIQAAKNFRTLRGFGGSRCEKRLIPLLQHDASRVGMSCYTTTGILSPS